MPAGTDGHGDDRGHYGGTRTPAGLRPAPAPHDGGVLRRFCLGTGRRLVGIADAGLAGTLLFNNMVSQTPHREADTV